MPIHGYNYTDIPCPYCAYWDHCTLPQMNIHIAAYHARTACYWPGCGIITSRASTIHRHLNEHQDDWVRGGGNPKRCPWPGCRERFGTLEEARGCVEGHQEEGHLRAVDEKGWPFLGGEVV